MRYMDTKPTTDSTDSSHSGRFPLFVFLGFFLPIALIVILAGLYYASQRTDDRIKEILDADSARLNLVSGFLGAEVLASLKHLRSLSTETITIRALDSGSPGDLQSLESSFLTLARRNSHYQQVRWIAESGIEMSSVIRDEDGPYTVAAEDLQNKSDRYYFKEANALLPGELYISRVELNEERGQIEKPIEPVLRVATPVADSAKKHRGIIVINIEMKHLFNLVRISGETQQDADFLLVNQQGVVLNGDIESFQAADEEEQGVDFMLPDPHVQEQVLASNSGSLELADGLWSWKKLSPFSTLKRLSRVFPQHQVSFDQMISDDFSLKLVAHRPPGSLKGVRSENLFLISLGVIIILSVYGVSLIFYLSGRARVRQAEVEAAHAMARESSMGRMKELEERFHRLVDASSIGQLVVDGNGRIEISNLAAEHILGYERGELEGFLVDALLPAGLQEKHAHHREQYMRAPEARMMGIGRELEAVRKDGSTIPVEVGLTPYTDHDRQLMLVSLIDLSHRDPVGRIG
jgi:PAS domain S-box-containing protein